jgi:hypothetical protein
LTFESDFFGIALIDIGLSGGDVSNESKDLLLDFYEIFLVDLNLLLELQLEVSSGNVGVDLIFLGLGDLSLDGGFKVVKELKKFSFNLSPSFSLSVLEGIEFEVSLVVVNVTRANFVGSSSLNISVGSNIILRVINELFLKLDELGEVTTSVDGEESR